VELPEIAAIIAIAQFGAKVISHVKKLRKSKAAPRKRKAVPRKPKQTKDEELVTKLLTDPVKAVKEMGAEYVVKNRKRISKGIEKRVTEEIERFRF